MCAEIDLAKASRGTAATAHRTLPSSLRSSARIRHLNLHSAADSVRVPSSGRGFLPWGLSDASHRPMRAEISSVRLASDNPKHKRSSARACFRESKMKAGFCDREAAAVLSPAVGGVEPALWFWRRNGAGFDALSVGGPCVWAIRDMLISYAVALPVLVFCRRFGMRSLISQWLIAALTGGPMGYALANPVEFALAPTEADLMHGLYWGLMLGYMTLFGLTGLLFAAVSKRGAARA
jgi:hypothetical protein